MPEIIAGLLEIVREEGPVHGERAYRLYLNAAGGSEPGPELRLTFHRAIRQALRAGLLRQIDDGVSGLDETTLYAPGRPSVLVRELGPRRLPEVPRAEVAKLVRYLGLAGTAGDEAKRAVLSAYGLARLTGRASRYLDECLTYPSSNSSSPSGGLHDS
jgi:hypothetical protein